MPRLLEPTYRKHSTRDIGMCQWNGVRHYFKGRFNSPESLAEFEAFKRSVLAESVAVSALATEVGTEITIAVLTAAFIQETRSRYPNAKRSEAGNVAQAVTAFGVKFASEPVASFGPKKLKAWQKELASKMIPVKKSEPNGATKPISRNYVNWQISRIKRMFRWGVSEELVPPAIAAAISSVPGIRAGSTGARETPRKKGVPWEHIEAIIPLLPKCVRAMVLFQWYSGARSGSICRATPSQFDRSGELWEWRPRHKTEQTVSDDLILAIGPKCQAVLLAFMEGDPSEPCFSPQQSRNNRRYGRRYKTDGYAASVARAIRRANKLRTPPLLPVPHWSPHRLRHGKGREVRSKYGAEAAQAVLGHASLDATQIYSDRRLGLAKEVAKDSG